MSDLLFRTPEGVFSYRVAGVLIQNGRVLLQRPPDDPGYAFPGGHVAFGETGEQALAREFREETGLEIRPTRMLWIGENFFPWGQRQCHQICLYYQVEPLDETRLPAGQRFQLQFSWVDLNDLEGILLYPMHVKEKLCHLSDSIEAFVYVETPSKDTQ
jgi:ADP-ribose pyrophosphatase YjhB (NUDIX family)